jgi:hypothetical protein
MYSLRLLYERIGEGIVVGDMIHFACVGYRLKVYECTLNNSIPFNSGVAYLTATQETLQLLSMDTNLVLELEGGERLSFEFSNVTLGKITIRFKERWES